MRLFPARPTREQREQHDADLAEALEHARAIGEARHLARLDALEERVGFIEQQFVNARNAARQNMYGVDL
jgi:hypothetical protein